MFKKPVNDWKTSSPLRTSDRKKLKLRVVSTFSISTEEADVLVPEGILSIKFKSHLNEPGVAYLAPDGDHDPLWFTLGKGSDLQQQDALIPTVYTLWKNYKLLPFLSTPKAVIPILSGGADLMIPGVVHCPQSLNKGQLVSIRKYERVDMNGTVSSMLSPPLAVGRMAVGSDQLEDSGQEKGKAVFVLHAWKDHLWELGSKGDVPADVPIKIENDKEAEDPGEEADDGSTTPTDAPEDADTIEATESTSNVTAQDTSITYTPDEVSQLLRMSLIQVIAQSLGSLPAPTFPIPATLFYTNHILPNRPTSPEAVILPSSSSAPEDDSPSNELPSNPDPYTITIKSSSFKSLSAFLKYAEKSGLITTKPLQKHSAQTDMLITAVNALHADVQTHRPFPTIGEAEAKAARKAARQEKELRSAASLELEIRELWKPYLTSVELFEAMGESPSNLYTSPEVRSLLNSYFAVHQLVNPHDQAYINLDRVLTLCVAPKSKSKSSKNRPEAELELQQAQVEFMRRDEAINKVLQNMQNWYEVKSAGEDGVTKKGKISPVQVKMKTRQGRRVSTLITGFEPFNIDPDVLSEDLRKLCAGAASISPVPGKPAGSGMEVHVQGKQSKAVVDYLLGKGVPKKWIEAHGISKGEK
ncbi:eukaryotic translation initiation factor SUI1 family protein [Lentinula aciculospora]|uniref:Eukaryotic translation initiation factor SUI1 family protein n=1 Tax=Lentinula aciculospora TaxID=153920 RepID=A0A9W9AET2_9AGAR|nr:eukaryotic translation initiation factor SUI1 family protein [Lentinula aciculospora]